MPEIVMPAAMVRLSAGRLGMTVLRSDRDAGAARERRKARDEGGGRAHQNVGLGAEVARAVDDFPELGSRPLQAVHFPIAGYEGARRHRGPPVRSEG